MELAVDEDALLISNILDYFYVTYGFSISPSFLFVRHTSSSNIPGLAESQKLLELTAHMYIR